MAVSVSCVIFSDNCITEGRRKKLAENMNEELEGVIKRQRNVYKEACKNYRIIWRVWEMAVVQKERFTREIHKLFRPGTTDFMLRAALRKRAADNLREHEGAFLWQYLGVAERHIAKSKDGKELLPTTASRHISLQNEALEMPEPSEAIQELVALVGPGEDKYTEEERLLNETVVEEACAHRLGYYMKDILHGNGECDNGLAEATDIDQ